MKLSTIKILLPVIALLLFSSCGRNIFKSDVRTVKFSNNPTQISVSKINTDHLYSMWFAVHDSILISSRPQSNDYIFQIADIKSNKELGAFMRRGEGDKEYTGLMPILRIEPKGDDLVSLTYDPNKQLLVEFNMTQSVKLGKDSLIRLGYFRNANEAEMPYTGIYRLDNSKYIGYTPGISFDVDGKNILLPTYSILEGSEIRPVKNYSFFNSESHDLPTNMSSLGSMWYLKPDKTKLVSAMSRLGQINIIDIESDSICSVRIEGSPNEHDLDRPVEDVKWQYHDVTCDDDFIYALYFGKEAENLRERTGCDRIHVFDWEGNFVNDFITPIQILKLWSDSSTGALYGYCEPEDAIYFLDVN